MKNDQMLKLSVVESTISTDGNISWLRRSWGAQPFLLHLVLFYVAYVLAGGFGQGLALIPGVTIIFWPPAGIFVATLLLSSRYSWPWWILAGGLAELTCNGIWFHNAIPLAVVYFSANALVALTAATLIRQFLDKPFRLETLEEVAAFAVLGAGIAPLVSATVIATTDALLGKHLFWTTWPLVWLGDSTGLLVSAPLTVVALQVWQNRAGVSWSRAFEAVVLLVILLGVSILSFKNYLPTPYVTLPPLLWLAVRFHINGAAAALALIAIMEALFAVTSQGTLGGQPGLIKDNIIGLQVFLGITAISSLLVAVLSAQYTQTLHKVIEANAKLERRVAERTKDLQEINTQQQLALAAAKMTAWHFNPQNGVVKLSPDAAVALELPAEQTIENATQGYALIHPDDLKEHRAKVEQAVLTNGHYVSRFRHVHDGNIVWFEEHAQAVLNATTLQTELIGITINVTEEKAAEEALRASERDLAALFAASNVGIAQADLSSRRFLRVNAAMSTITGFSEIELLAMTVDDLNHPDVRAQDREAWRSVRGESGYAAEKPYKRKDGSTVWVHVTANLIHDSEGNPLRAGAIIYDITSRKLATEALEASERFSRGVLEASPDCVQVMAPEGQIEFMNGNGQIQMEIDDFARYAGAQWSTLWPEETRPIIENSLMAAKCGVGSRFEAFAPTAKGTPKWWDVVATPVLDAHGRCTRIVSVAREITARRQAENALRESEERFRGFFENFGIGAAQINLEGRITHINNRFCQITGYSREELLGELGPLHLDHPDEVETDEKRITDFFQEGSAYLRYEKRYLHKNGHVVWVRVTVTPILDDRGSTRTTAALIEDITEHKRHEQHQALLMNELNHRVKNTLATIQSMASQTMRSSPSLAEAKTRFEARLMSLSKAHDVLTREKWESAPLADIVDRAIQPYRESRQDRFAVNGPDIRISAPMALAFSMTLHELCTNAVKYGALSQDKGKVTIAWSVLRRKNAGPLLKFRWSEKGGPPVAPPTSRGFGTKLIERGLANDLGGDVKINFARNGVSCVINAVLDTGEGAFLNLAKPLAEM